MPAGIYYYNTPHVSMGSVHSDGGILQSRYNSTIFGADPSMGLRVEITLPNVPSHKRRYEARGRVVQHKNWLVGQGTLYEDGGIQANKVGPWNVYRVSKGLCAHMELPDSYHVLQVSDLDTFTDERSFVATLSVPRREGDQVEATTMDGDRLVVDLTDMSISINGAPRPHPPKMLHDCQWMQSEYGSGRIAIHTKAGSVTFDSTDICPPLYPLPQLAEGEFRWGNPISDGSTTKVNHTRALGGVSPDGDTVLKSISILLPATTDAQIRLAVYAGGSLEDGPHVGTQAQLLYDFGLTPKGQDGWITLEHPEGGIPVPPNTPLWLAWKGMGDKVYLKYQELPPTPTDLQTAHGRWESKAIESDENKPWPETWPASDSGKFEPFWYSVYVTLQ